jgi:hypothetical protein
MGQTPHTIGKISRQLELFIAKLERREQPGCEMIERLNCAATPAANPEPSWTRADPGERLENTPKTLNLWLEFGMMEPAETTWSRFPDGAIQELINKNTISPDE